MKTKLNRLFTYLVYNLKGIKLPIHIYKEREKEQNKTKRLRISIIFQTRFGVWPSSVEKENTMFLSLVRKFIQKSYQHDVSNIAKCIFICTYMKYLRPC